MPTPAAPAAADPLLEHRHEFAILERTIYMISHSLGAMPRGVHAALREYSDTWEARGVRAWNEGWWELAVELGNLLAPLIGAPPDTVTMLPNVTTAEAIVLSALDYPPERDGLVYTELDFPSVVYLYQGEARRGARLVPVPSADGISVPAERIVERIDERTRVVALSHVLFRSAYVVDVEPVIRRAHEVGAIVMLDAYQSVGTLPVDVAAWDLDVLAGGSVKWLCGGPGAGYLYVKPALRERLEPAFTGWMAHQRPFAFEPRMELAAGPYRFLNGTPHVPCLYAARPGYEIVRRVGVPAIREKSLRLTGRMLEWARELGIRTRTPREPGRRGGTVSFDVPHPDRVAEQLIRREIIVDWRPDAGVRMSPHFYTREDELDEAVQQLHRISREVGR
ncbi:MAG TPA: aminotransferase class V-fold PLP-dependent enzyme [Candidatus Saccharimonadales bacterium]|nr:aminotransferase class V-fold PLP-dependent enzyme [Candidatus Saccharimonadales bacterium]